MTRDRATAQPSLRDLLLRSDFGRANPRRVDELLDRTAASLLEDRTHTARERADAAD